MALVLSGDERLTLQSIQHYQLFCIEPRHFQILSLLLGYQSMHSTSPQYIGVGNVSTGLQEGTPAQYQRLIFRAIIVSYTAPARLH
jgi:hypothetical protein